MTNITVRVAEDHDGGFLAYSTDRKLLFCMHGNTVEEAWNCANRAVAATNRILGSPEYRIVEVKEGDAA